MGTCSPRGGHMAHMSQVPRWPHEACVSCSMMTHPVAMKVWGCDSIRVTS
jgi:hypothetical protein